MDQKLENLPENSGVYLFKNNQKKVIYVGKALNIRKRVLSYFKTGQVGKVKLLTSKVASLEIIKVSSEIEALLLEATLIKRYQPYFNSRLKDDKDYLYILFTKEDYPRVKTARKKETAESSDFFGPFTSSIAARETLKIARRIFPFRTTCKPNSAKACLSFHLGLCPGVCIGSISKKDYSKNLSKLKRFLSGQTAWVIDNLEKEMFRVSRSLDFESAAQIKRKIDSIKLTTRRLESVDRYLTGPEVLESIYEKQLKDLKEKLNLTKNPTRIECYDISNIGVSSAVGSMVVLINGEESKKDYRRFKIKAVSGINDPAMISEVLTRRFRNDWAKPDLIIVDGGKAQLNAALSVLRRLDMTIPVFGLAKKQEELHFPDKQRPSKLAKNSPALFLLQRIRDEAHRFAIQYHRQIRSKKFLDSAL